MRSTRAPLFIIVFLVSVTMLFFILDNIVSSGSVPSLQQFIASSTPAMTGEVKYSSTTVAEMFAITPTISISLPNGKIQVMIASTTATKELGLGKRASMPADYGMLFSFPNPGRYGFWMKDMNFPIDMVWIDAEKKVVSVTSSVSPETYPNIFLPPSPISYVLELNAGVAKGFGIATDTVLRF